MVKWLIILGIAAGVAWLYGWRVHPEALPDYFSNANYKRPVVTRQAKNAFFSEMGSGNALDNITGDYGRQEKEVVQRQKQQREQREIAEMQKRAAG